METLSTLLLVFILFCAVAVSLTKDLLTSIIIFMAQSTAMSVIWLLLRSPDLAITEDAVGAGVNSILMFVALKKLHAIKTRRDKSDEQD